MNNNRNMVLVGLTAIAALAPNLAYAVEGSISSVHVVENAGQKNVVVEMTSSVEGAAVSSFTMNDPLRIVLDIVDAEILEGWADNSVTSGAGIKMVSVKQFNDDQGKIARVEIFLEEEFEHVVRSEGNQITLTLSSATVDLDPLADLMEMDFADEDEDPLAILMDAPDIVEDNSDPLAQALAEAEGNKSDPGSVNGQQGAFNDAGIFVPSSKLSGPAELPGGTSLTSLDFEQETGMSKVIIGTKNLGTFSHTRPRPDTLLIDVEGAFVPQSLSRVLNTDQFYSPVKMIRAYRTSKGARISISIADDAKITVNESSNGFIVIEVPVPESIQQEQAMAEQQASMVSPATPDTGISNAYQKEILIGETGDTSDPQAVFGSGSGSNDPAAMLGMASGFMFDSTSSSSNKYTGKRISLDFVNADIHSIFRLISHVSNLNIITGDDVSGRITVRLENVPWDQALAAVLQAKGLGSQKFGNIIRVAPIETIKIEQQAALETRRAQEELTELQLLVLPLNYAQASELQSQVTELISARGSLQVDTRGNQLIIHETEKRLAQIRELIRHLDKQTPQVLIEARVVEASSNFTQMMGIQWGSELNASAATGYSTGLKFPSSVGVSGGLTQVGGETFYAAGQDTLLVDMGAEASKAGIAFSLGSIPGVIDLDARLSAMETDGFGKVISEPRITTLDNEAARISQGARVPYLSTSSGGTQVQFVEAALEMNVTPHITSDNQIFLDIQITNNRPDFSQLVQGQPAIQIKEAETKVLVANGDTTVIGGVFSTETSYSEDRVPGFHRIPFIGSLFRNSADQMTRNEMMVFITPHIVTRTVTTD